MLDINQASKKELTTLKGIGASFAERIINYRQENDGFTSKEEIKEVKGIGTGTYNNLSDQIKVDGEVSVATNNDLKEVIFNPADYGIAEVNEVHLVGDMNDWNPADKTYQLKKDEAGIWRGEFDLEDGTEVKFMYDSSSWEEDKHVGDLNGMNKVL